MTEKRFTIPKGYRVIKDNVTDKCATFYDNDDGETFLKWLNELHEENQKLQNELETYKSGNVVLKKTLDKYEKVMRKYELDSVEKLDQVLREQRVW